MNRFASLLLLLLVSLSPRLGRPAPVEDALTAAEQIDPFIGTEGKDRGSCMPGPCLPHASIYPSPDSGEPQPPSGYRADGGIAGFSQLHTQGTGGVPSFGNLLVSPQIGLSTDEKDHVSSKTDERARAYVYAVTLTRYGIRCECTPSAHAALYKFTFPASTDAHLVLDVARKIASPDSLEDGTATINPATGTISGGGTYGGNWAPGKFPLHFTARLSKKPASFGTWNGSTVNPGNATVAIKKTAGGIYTGFSMQADETIYLKIAVSFRSQAQSARYLQDEIPDWDFAKVQAQAAAAWNRELGTVTVTGGDPEEVARFYTGLFHTMVQPRNRTGDRWDDDEPFWDDHYTLWDSWRTVYPLLGLVDQDSFRDIVNSFIARHRRNGYVPEAVIGGVEYAAGQGGNEVDNVIAEAYLDGVPGIDWQAAYDVTRFDAEQMRTVDYRAKGYTSIEEPKTPYSARRMHSGAATIEFAYNDACVALLAKALGKPDDYAKYLRRSQNWTNVWNDTLTDAGITGFPNSRHADGTFSDTSARRGYDEDFYEGTGWIYSYRPTQDVPALFEKMGGKPAFLKRLVYALKNHLVDFTNEPSFQTIWLFDAVDRPYLASYWADRLRSLYPGRTMPGDEDNGAMSSLYCFLDLGIFPLAGQDVYCLHGGRLPEVSFRLHDGKQFTILSRNAGPANLYVQSAKFNGQPLETPRLRHADIFHGGTLEFVMGPQPSAWGCAGEFNAEDAAAELK